MVSKGQFTKLFEPTRIGPMQLKNRIVMPPMGTGSAEEEGYVGQRMIDYYEARAKGGAGLIIVEVTAPDLQCKGPRQLTLGDDRYVPGWQDLIAAIHRHGAKIAVQLQHSGWEIRDGQRVQVAPSAITSPTRVVGVSGALPHELTTGEIGEIVQWFAAATKRAKEAGFDGVEIHGAHQYLVASFLSSETNVRQDEYGGSVENKARFMIEIIEAARQAVGPDYPVWPRLNGQEYGLENGVTIEETIQVVPMLAKAGASAVHISGYAAGSEVTKAPITDTPGFLVPLAEEVKKVTSIPVIAVGRLDPELGERILEEGKTDLIAIGRRLIADPELPNKAAEGRLDDIIPCTGCMECIERPQMSGRGIACAVNAATGREREYRIQPAVKAKRVVVVGGGNSAFTAMRDLQNFASEIHLIHRRKEFRADKLLVQEARNAQNVTFHTPMIVRSFLGKDRLTGVRLESVEGKERYDLNVDGVFLEIGLTPNTLPVKDLVELNSRGEVPVNKDQSTTIEGMFAAGDVTDVEEKQISIAVGQGALAALSAHKYLVENKLTKGSIGLKESWQ